MAPLGGVLPWADRHGPTATGAEGREEACTVMCMGGTVEWCEQVGDIHTVIDAAAMLHLSQAQPTALLSPHHQCTYSTFRYTLHLVHVCSPVPPVPLHTCTHGPF